MNTSILHSTEPNIVTLSVIDDQFFNHLRATEYSRIDEGNHTYLDYTGGNLYAKSLVLKHQDLLLNHVFGNPHSTNPTSKLATNLVEEARAKVLDFFNAKDYYCVFTANASAALKILGESFPFNEKSTFILFSDNHNSVNGIREFCHSRKAKSKYIPVHYQNLEIDEEELIASINEANATENNLMAFPAQSNVSGVKHNQKWIAYAQEKGFDVLLDAAAYVPTTKLDLSVVKPNFVSASFYKIFGYPTGLGCLLIRKDSFAKLQKPWFAGGTVSFVSVVNEIYYLENNHERFEDGTINYLDIPAIKMGLDYIESIGLERISKRLKALIETLYNELIKLKHDNGRPIVKMFGPENFDHRGGNIIMNFFDVNGKIYSGNEFENLTNANMISIRSGCFCNPGIDEINYCITHDEVGKYFTNKKDEDYKTFIAHLKQIRGAIRVSVGIATTTKDLEKYINLVNSLKNKAK